MLFMMQLKILTPVSIEIRHNERNGMRPKIYKLSIGCLNGSLAVSRWPDLVHGPAHILLMTHYKQIVRSVQLKFGRLMDYGPLGNRKT